jgi:outer membrane receptor protein involved in Fe transport
MRIGCTAFIAGLVFFALSARAGAEGAAPPAPPAAPATAIIAGKVIDKVTGEPIIDAGVELVGQGVTLRTDIDGKYRFKVAPGRYQVRFFAPQHQGVRLENVVATADKVATADVSLAPTEAGVLVVEVVAQANKATEATQLQQRRKSAVVSETVSAETIKKTPDSDAAEVVQRVPAVTVKDNKFIYVRGLGERYSSALLNGSRLPSTDPDRRVVPLDLFPADFVESLAVTKSYTPDLPGDFSGGLADIHLLEFPEKLTLSFGLSGGGNTNVTFQDYRTYKGGSLDYLGLGGSARNIPARVPDDLRTADDSTKSFSGKLFKDIWSPKTEEAPPNSGLAFSLGNSFGPLGVSFSGLYSNEYKRRLQIERELVNTGSITAPDVRIRDDFRYDVSEFETRIGGIFTAAYKLGTNHKLTFRSLLDRNTTDEVSTGSGPIEQLGPTSNELQTSLRYSEEQLAFGQLAGEHRWSHLWIDWRAAFSQSMQDVPDARYLTYVTSERGVIKPAFSNDSLGGSRIFSALDEVLFDSALDMTVPFSTRLPLTDVWSGLPAKLKFGPAWSNRDRDFAMRRFRYRVPEGAFDLTAPAEQLLAPGNIGAGGVTFDEETQPRDDFRASQRIIGGYGMLDLPLVADTLRIVAGTRYEDSHIRLSTSDDQGNPVHPVKDDGDWLPGANLIYSPREDMNFRLAFSRSVSRPEFRELSPTQFPAPRGLRPVVGNPNLQETRIKNYDARWEWFLSPLELVSLSFFKKDLAKPIEQTVIPQSSNNADSFINATDAELIGFEAEGRKDFGFVWSHLQYLSLLANVAYVDATVNVPRQKTGGVTSIQTSTSRPLQGQARYIVNAALDFTHPGWGSARLLYNTAGSRISSAGSFGLPDIIEQPRDELDVVFVAPLRIFDVPFNLKLAAENLLDDPVLYTQGGFVQRSYTSGIKVSAGLSYAY